MSRWVRAWLLMACGVAVAPGWAEFKVDVRPEGAVVVEVDGVRCLEDFRVILPWPGWRGGAGPADCVREEPEPEHVRVRGIFSDGEPCARFTLDARTSPGGADLSWELEFTRDFETETVRLNGYLPCAAAAGKAAWFIRGPADMKGGLFPASLGEPGGEFSNWGFDWFGWLLPGGQGIKFRPGYGLRDMYMQDGRQWGADYFQTCWTLVRAGVVAKGTVLRCGIRVEPLTAQEVLAAAEGTQMSFLALDGVLEGATEGVRGRIEVRNIKPQAQEVALEWQVSDDIGAVLAQGKRTIEVRPSSVEEIEMQAPATASGDYRLRVEATAAGEKRPVVLERRIVVSVGPRERLSLDGTWELLAAEEGAAEPPKPGGGKPTQVPGTIPSSPNRHWFLRSFDLPPTMEGRRLRLLFGAVNHKAEVWVNGRRVGEYLGGNVPFEMDVTGFVRPGRNELAVLVTNWTAFCTNPPQEFVVKPFEHPGWKIPPKSIIGPIGGSFLMTGIWRNVALEATADVYVEDVFVQTSVRRKQIRVAVTIRNAGAAARRVRMTNLISDRSGPAKDLGTTELQLAAGERREVVVEAPWRNPHLWFLNDPYLYRLTTTLAEGGKVVDQVATRFGFREVWTEGPRFVLNGVPMKLFATSGWSMNSWEAARAHILRMKAAGTRAMRLHTQPWEEHILAAADELGMLIVDEAGVYCYAPSYAPEDPRFWENYTRHVLAMAKRDRNHPSLAIYSLENEIISCGGDKAVWEPGLGRLADALRQVDPTRLITCESDLDPAGKMDIIGMHYPREYWSGFTLYPEKCWWMDEEIPYIGQQWKWRRDKPLYIGEFDGGFMAWYPQYQAFWLGDEAYRWRGRVSATSPNSRARREMVRMEVEAYRWYGVTGLNPWFDPDEVDVFGPEAYAPITVAVREKTHNFYPGQRITRTVYVYNDSFAAANLELAWTALVPGAKPQTGKLSVRLGPCEAAERTISFLAPAVRERTALKLRLVLRSGGKTVCVRGQEGTVFPRSGELRAGAVYVYDPVGRTMEVLRALGVEARAVEALDAVLQDAKVLVIGAGVLRGGAAPWAEKLARWVDNGGRVVCLEQEEYPDGWLPVEVELDPKHATVIAFPRAHGHPVLTGLREDDLRFWQPDHIVARKTLIKPMRGNFVPVVDAGGIRSAIDDMNGLNWAPVLELPYGRGRYVLSQLALGQRAGVEPAADILLRNLLRYAAEGQPPTRTRVGLVADPDSKLKAALDGMGLAYESLLGAVRAERLGGLGLVIAGGGPEAWKSLREGVAAVKEWVRGGGVLWLNEVGPEEAGLVGEIVGGRCELRAADAEPMWLTAPDPLTSGVSNHELYWRDRPIWDQWTEMRKIVEYVPRIEVAGAVALTDPPGLVKVPVGQGWVLVNQLLWASTEQNRVEGLKIASVLLTNLGAELGLSSFRSVAPEDFVPVDISRWCNLSLRGDPDSGWMGHGPDALAGFPVGRQVLGGAVFEIATGEKAVIALRGREKPNYPDRVTGITIGAKARALHFLHTCAWGGAGGEAATYVIHYEDGTTVRVPLHVGVELADWYVEPRPLPAARVAWRGYIADKPGPIGVHAMRWVNPYPGKVITAMDFVSACGEPVPVLIAISVEK